MLGEEGVEVGGESLVEPDVRPVLAGHHVTEPLVRQLVGDQPILVLHQGLDLIEEGRVRHRGGRAVLHASVELGEANLCILGIRIGLAGLLVEEANHLGGLAHEPASRCLVNVPGHVVIDRQVAHLVVERDEIRGGDRDEIGRMRLVHLPVEGPGAVGVLLGLHQSAVGDHAERPGDRDDHLGRDAVVGIIVAGKPVVVVLGLPLRPDGLWLLGIGRVGGHKMEPGLRVATVADRQVKGILRPVGLVESDRERLALGRELAGGRLLAGGDPGDLQFWTAVEVDRGQVRMERGQGMRHRPMKLLLLGVEGQLGLDVLDVHLADASFLMGRVGRGKRSTCGPCWRARPAVIAPWRSEPMLPEAGRWRDAECTLT